MEYENLLVARRSIYDAKVKVVGYHLLFENVESVNEESNRIPEALSVSYLKQAFHDDDMHSLIGSGLVMVNFSEAMLEEDIEEELQKDRILIGLNKKYILFNDKVLAAAKRLHENNFKIAVSGFTDKSEIEAYIPYAHTIMIDTKHFDNEGVTSIVNMLSGSKVKAFAENIETHESFEMCKDLGCHLFEGYFLALPNLENKQKVTSNRLTTMRLLVALDDPDITLDKVEELLSQDARLSYRLLRAVNSAAYGLPRVVNSLREAVVFLGLKQVRSWASVIVLTSLDDKPTDLMLTTMIRARMCELIAEVVGIEDTKPYFTAGLFSTLDAMLDRSKEEIFGELTLSDELRDALCNQEGMIGSMLCNVIAYGRGEWDELNDSGIEMETWRNAYVESVHWASTSFKEMTS